MWEPLLKPLLSSAALANPVMPLRPELGEGTVGSRTGYGRREPACLGHSSAQSTPASSGRARV